MLQDLVLHQPEGLEVETQLFHLIPQQLKLGGAQNPLATAILPEEIRELE
jgi:hypothetical protein